MNPESVEILIYSILAGVVGVGIAIFGVVWKISRASKADRTEMYKYVNDGHNSLESELRDVQDKYADMREELGFIKGVLSTK